MRHSPCNTVILIGGLAPACKIDKILVGSTDSVHDSTTLFLASRLAKAADSAITLTRIEREFGQVVLNVGQRDLQRLIRTTGMQEETNITCRVLPAGNWVAMVKTLEKHDLIMIGANSRYVHSILNATTAHTVAIVKRAPAVRPWHRGSQRKYWLSGLNEADYTNLYDGLRFGSRLNADFLTMLSLAAVVASMGLLQNSVAVAVAVVIGSMLLAPLMTPMLGCGLALAQANPALGNRSLISVVIGLLCTLAISTGIGWLTPGNELTPQILARGDPTAFDLVVAAAYALARPSLVGSIAGVAIATALVPPLCATGLSLAYRDYANAEGAALLFRYELCCYRIERCFHLSHDGGALALGGLPSARVGASNRDDHDPDCRRDGDSPVFRIAKKHTSVKAGARNLSTGPAGHRGAGELHWPALRGRATHGRAPKPTCGQD